MDKKELETYLRQDYKGYQSFLDKVLFPIFGEGEGYDEYQVEALEGDSASDSGISSIKKIWRFFAGVDIEFLDVTVSDRVKMERNRADVQKTVIKGMGTYTMAFMVFHYENSHDKEWRFSLCEIGESKKDITDYKRYTFQLGPGQSCRTAAENFNNLIENKGNITDADIRKAFSVQVLSDAFFNGYKKYYNKFVTYITGKEYVKEGDKYVERESEQEQNVEMYEAFGRNDCRVRDYIKRLLGRIVFLHFLQKKRWLGVPAGEDWNSGMGMEDFMLRLYNESSEEQKDDFLESVLEPLFIAIDTDRAGDNYTYDTKVFGRLRVPYLNGGLFERNEDDRIICRFPKDFFSGVLTLFSHYNFTIDENDPYDSEIGVDPEMLSRIFENLLEDNKDKGAYYTPKEVVHYMCSECLIAYLQTDYDEEKQKKVRDFVKNHNVEAIADFKEEIDKRLREVKACDPAIGSGAFPMGMLREIFQCRYDLEKFDDPSKIKREIIQNNLYGVDIEKGAVEIARLRFWLSIIVDEKTPETLPNLDFKIMEGNSLLTTFKGQYVNLDTTYKVRKKSVTHIITNMNNMVQEQKAFYDSDGQGKLEHEVQIKHLIVDCLKSYLEDEYNVWLSTEYSTGDMFGGESVKYKKSNEPTDFPQELMDILSECNNLDEQLLDEDGDLRLRAETVIPFFDWRIMFYDVFSPRSKHGFDILIGNPPYVSAPNQINNPTLKKQREELVECGKYKTLTEKWDLYIPFMELGLQLLTDKGVFAMIVPYPLSNQKYGKKMRKMITEETQIVEMADLNGTKIFKDATVSNCIPILRKDKPKETFPIIHIEDSTRNFYFAFNKSLSELVQDKKSYVWNFTEEKREGNRFADMNVLGDYCYISVGMVLNADEKTAQGEFSKDDLISDTQDEIHFRKYIEAKDIDRYEVKRVRYLEWDTERCPGKLRRPTFRELYEQPKLMFNRLGTLKVYLDVDTHFLHSDSMFSAVPWHYLHGVNNKSIKASIKRYSHLMRDEMVRLSKKIDIYYLLAILNSSTAEKLLADQRGGDYHIYPEHIRNIPIAPASEDLQQRIGNLAKQVLEGKKNGSDTTAIEKEIDDEVAKLYNHYAKCGD